MHELPNRCRDKIEAIALSYGRETLIRCGQQLSKRYRQETGERRRLNTPEEAAAYAVARMPATYGAVHFALAESFKAAEISPQSQLDCGSGTGAFILAAADLVAPKILFCQDMENAMTEIAWTILEGCGHTLDFFLGDIRTCRLPKADLVTEGYMLGELPKNQQESVLLKMWDVALQLLLLVEPGTPEGFETIRRAAELLTEQGAHIAAPCPATSCSISGNDWCHFSVRVSRSQLQKQIKGGEAPYEDEKFCYMAFTREPPAHPCEARILRHPQIAPGKISLELCTAQGITTQQITKKDPLWKRARKSEWGSTFP